MTTIAFDGRYIAADSLVSYGGKRSTTQWQKLIIEERVIFGFAGLAQNFERELIGGYLNGFAGYKRVRNAVGHWCLRSQKEGDLPDLLGDGESTLIVFERGRLSSFDGCAHGHSKAAPDAFGSGSPFALGAMATGASAMEAVDAASRWDLLSGGDILFVDTQRIRAGVRFYGPTQRERERRREAKEEDGLLTRILELTRREVTLDGIAAEVDLAPGEIADFLPDLAKRDPELAEDLQAEIEAWRGDEC
jgi:ATP-dependent protease HslVU (ClpYQ) peptidase subunit